MTWIKICGVTNLEDALMAARLGADALGFNFFRGSPRCVTPKAVAAIVAALPETVEKVGVFVDEIDERVRDIQKTCGLTWLQFHGEEPQSYCKKFSGQFVKVFRVENERDLQPLSAYLKLASYEDRFLLDSRVEGMRGGSGETFDWELAFGARAKGKLILSGGLKPENIKLALAKVRPFGIDVASGVEADTRRAPGRKDKERLRQLIETVRKWDQSQKRKK